jgi:hypothetical protein
MTSERANETGRNETVVTARHGAHLGFAGQHHPSRVSREFAASSFVYVAHDAVETHADRIGRHCSAPRRRRLSIPGTPAYRKGEA